jgi:hypothetical protein
VKLRNEDDIEPHRDAEDVNRASHGKMRTTINHQIAIPTSTLIEHQTGILRKTLVGPYLRSLRRTVSSLTSGLRRGRQSNFNWGLRRRWSESQNIISLPKGLLNGFFYQLSIRLPPAFF